jgi:hypothetical protein
VAGPVITMMADGPTASTFIISIIHQSGPPLWLLFESIVRVIMLGPPPILFSFFFLALFVVGAHHVLVYSENLQSCSAKPLTYTPCFNIDMTTSSRSSYAMTYLTIIFIVTLARVSLRCVLISLPLFPIIVHFDPILLSFRMRGTDGLLTMVYTYCCYFGIRATIGNGCNDSVLSC